MNGTDRHIIADIPKRKNVHIRITRFAMIDREIVEIRQYQKNRYGIYEPTKKAVTIPPECLSAVIKGLVDAKVAIDGK